MNYPAALAQSAAREIHGVFEYQRNLISVIACLLARASPEDTVWLLQWKRPENNRYTPPAWSRYDYARGEGGFEGRHCASRHVHFGWRSSVGNGVVSESWLQLCFRTSWFQDWIRRPPLLLPPAVWCVPDQAIICLICLQVSCLLTPEKTFHRGERARKAGLNIIIICIDVSLFMFTEMLSWGGSGLWWISSRWKFWRWNKPNWNGLSSQLQAGGND